MSHDFKEKMEVVRMNPRKYFHDHFDKFEHLEILNADDLLMLLYGSIGYGADVKLSYEKILKVLESGRVDDLSDVGMIYYYNIIALGERYNGQYDLSKSLYFESYSRALKIKDDELAARALLGVAACFDLKGDQQEAMTIMNQILKMTVAINNHMVLGDIFSNYARIKNNMGDVDGVFMAYDTANMHYTQVENYKSYINYCVHLGNVAIMYIGLDRKDEADHYISELVKIYDEDGFLLVVQGAVKVIADYYASRKQYKRSYELFGKLIEAQNIQNLMFYSSGLKNDAHIVSQIISVENLRNENRILASENAMLHEKIFNNFSENQQDVEMMKSIGEGLNNSEFIPFFQAVWDTQTTQITGYEVLARWKKNEREILSPFHFIDLIEDTPMIVDLSEQVIRKGLAIFGNRIKRLELLTISVSFNIAPYQLVNQDLVTFLESVCVEYGVPKNQVVLEITERTFIDYNTVAIKQLHDLKRSGFKLALDDFGTGYASLVSIAELPLDIVKIDRSLVREISSGGKALQLFKGIIYMINSLELVGVAEGIETDEQLLLLKSMGCSRIQGYLLHRPEPGML